MDELVGRKDMSLFKTCLFLCLLLGCLSRSFGHDLSLMTIDKERNEDWPIDWELWTLAQLSFHHNSAVKWTKNHSHCTDSPANLSLQSPLTCGRDPEILDLLHLGVRTLRYSEWTVHQFPAENHGLRLRGADLIYPIVLLGTMGYVRSISDYQSDIWCNFRPLYRYIAAAGCHSHVLMH